MRALENSANYLSTYGSVVTEINKKIWAVKALTLTDLTTLAGDDTESNVHRLCLRAAYPFPKNILNKYFHETIHDDIHTAAICVYPNRVNDAYYTLDRVDKLDIIQIAAVATGFPTGQYPLSSRLEEIRFAIEAGATEIDVVINRTLVLTGKWKELYDEILAMKVACGQMAKLKTILAIGECGSMQNVYKASMIAMMAGSEFIKTSTGKETVNATIPVGLLMIRAIQDFKKRTGRNIGLKPAGGVRTVNDAIEWMTMIKNTLGDEWLNPNLFRFGASGLLDDIEKIILK